MGVPLLSTPWRRIARTAARRAVIVAATRGAPRNLADRSRAPLRNSRRETLAPRVSKTLRRSRVVVSPAARGLVPSAAQE